MLVSFGPAVGVSHPVSAVSDVRRTDALIARIFLPPGVVIVFTVCLYNVDGIIFQDSFFFFQASSIKRSGASPHVPSAQFIA